MAKRSVAKRSPAKHAGATARAAKRAEPSGAETDSLAGRIRTALARKNFTEQKMFGGTCFLINGNMLVGASKRGLLVRIGKHSHAKAVARPHARAMEMRGRTMEGYVYVDPPGTVADKDLRFWLELAAAHVETLPAKAKPNKAKASRA